MVDVKNTALTPDVAAPLALPAAAPAGMFDEFFRRTYRKLLAAAMYMGATEDEAEEAAASAMEEVFRRWHEIGNPLAYARKATVSNFLKHKSRHRQLVRRMIERGDVAGGYDDPGIRVWEDREWVAQLLSALSPAQREVMIAVLDDFRPAEVAQLLGSSSVAVRQNLHSARRRLIQLLTSESTAGSPARIPDRTPKEDRDGHRR